LRVPRAGSPPVVLEVLKSKAVLLGSVSCLSHVDAAKFAKLYPSFERRNH